MNEKKDPRLQDPSRDPMMGKRTDTQSGDRTRPGTMKMNDVKNGGKESKIQTPTKNTSNKQAVPRNTVSPAVRSDNTFRYWIRMLKGSFLPILYVIVSIFMLRKYVYEYTDYYEYNVLMILLGFILGAVSMTGMTLFNIYRAKSNRKKGAEMKSMTTMIVFFPILLVIVVLALVYGISTVWQFSIGFFVTSIIPPVVVVLSEVVSKGKFLVWEKEDSKKGRRLFLVPGQPE